MSIISILEFQVRPESVDAAAPILAGVLAETRAFDGNISIVVAQDTADPTRFLAVETWASLEHDAAYREWRTGEGAAGLAELRQHYSAPPKLTVGTTREDI